MKTRLIQYGIGVLAVAGLLLTATPHAHAATTYFSDGSENSPVGVLPGVNDPTVGIWDYHWNEPLSILRTRTGATTDGPTSAYAGNNYLHMSRGPGAELAEMLAEFSSPVDITTGSLHAEFQMFMKGAAWNLFTIGLVNDHGYTPAHPDASNYLVPFIFGDYVGDARTHSYYWDGTAWVDTGLNLTDSAWNKVTMDWHAPTATFTLVINGTAFAVPSSAFGTATTIARLHFFPAPGVAFFDDVLIHDTVPEPPPSLITYFSDGSENSTVGVLPGVNDPTIGIWDFHWNDALSILRTRTGATTDGPTSAYAGNNYLHMSRGPANEVPEMLAQFTSPVDITASNLHAEFQMFMKGTAWNLFMIGLVNVADYNPTLPGASNYLVPFIFGDYVGDARTHSYYYDGAAWVDCGLDLTDNAWNKVTMDWHAPTATFKLGVNGTLFAVPSSAFGTATTIARLHFWPAPGVAFFDEVLIHNTVPPRQGTVILVK